MKIKIVKMSKSMRKDGFKKGVIYDVHYIDVVHLGPYVEEIEEPEDDGTFDEDDEDYLEKKNVKQEAYDIV